MSRNVPAMAVTTAVIVGSNMLWAPIFSLIMRDLGASDLQISLAISVWALIGAVAQYYAGLLADRVGRFPLIVYPMHLGGLALVAAGFMPSWLPFAVIYTVWAVGNAVTSPVFSLIVGESVPPAKRGRAFGLIEFSIGVSLILGPLAGAKLLPYVGAKGLLIISGVLVAAAATGRLLSLRETRPESTGSKPFAFRHVFEGRMGLVLLAVALWNVVLVMTMWGPFLSLHASDAMGLSKPTINLFFALSSVVSALMSLLAGKLVGRFGANRMLSIGGLGLAAAVVLWSVQRSMAGIVGGFVLMSAFMMLAMVASDTFRVSVVEESVRGRALGAIGMITGFATAVATPVAGYLKQFSSTAPFWISLAAAAGLAASVVALTRHDTRTGFHGGPAHEGEPGSLDLPGG
ncbi:MAG: MFS transporter [Bacillota bacterium]|nr:MAG: MFS transporter [Bacillota bacterium]